MSEQHTWRMSIQFGKYGRAGIVSNLCGDPPQDHDVERCFARMFELIKRDMEADKQQGKHYEHTPTNS